MRVCVCACVCCCLINKCEKSGATLLCRQTQTNARGENLHIKAANRQQQRERKQINGHCISVCLSVCVCVTLCIVMCAACACVINVLFMRHINKRQTTHTRTLAHLHTTANSINSSNQNNYNNVSYT